MIGSVLLIVAVAVLALVNAVAYVLDHHTYSLLAAMVCGFSFGWLLVSVAGRRDV